MCIFCKIAKKEVEAYVVYEDEKVIAFLDIRPLSRGHTLVIPKEHYESFLEVPEEIAANLMKAVKAVCERASKLGAEGFNIVTNVGKAAGQEIMHAHIHVIPRYSGDSRPVSFGKPVECDLKEVYSRLTKTYNTTKTIF